MARMIPQFFDEHRTPPGEKMVFRALRECPDDWIVLHQVHLAADSGEPKTELDFVVILPQQGLLVIEVKSHSAVVFDDGGWKLGRKQQSRGPFEQADDGIRTLLRRLVMRIPTLSTVSFQKCVIFPMAVFSGRSAGWSDWEWLDRQRFRESCNARRLDVMLVESLAKSHQEQYSSPRRPRAFPEAPRPLERGEIESVVSWLRPFIGGAKLEREVLTLRRQAIDDLTAEQYTVLDALVDNPRVLVRGPAGTGKTVLATQLACHWHTDLGLRPVFLCYNRLLANSLRDRLEGVMPTTAIDSIHRLMLRCARISPPRDASSQFWETTLPIAAVERILDGDRVIDAAGALILDEAQDVIRNQHYLDFLECLLDDQLQRSNWAMFGDFQTQLFYAKEDELEAAIQRLTHFSGVKCCAEYSLRRNCRNTREIGTSAVVYSGLPTSLYDGFLRTDGGPQDVELLGYSTDDDMFVCLQRAVQQMQQYGLKASEITLLSLSPLTKLLRSELESRLAARPWMDRGHRLGYETAQRFKGLEAEGIILFNSGSMAPVRLQALLYVGCTRATMKLTMLVHDSLREWLLRELTAGTSERTCS